MVKFLELKGYQNFEEYAKNINYTTGWTPPVYFFFSGSKTEDGISWCPDCVEAEPVVKAYLSEVDRNIVFAYVDVGDREYWKDKACPFRTDKRIRLMVIPTIIKWKGVQRLEGSQCNKRELLQMMFEEEEQ